MHLWSPLWMSSQSAWTDCSSSFVSASSDCSLEINLVKFCADTRGLIELCERMSVCVVDLAIKRRRSEMRCMEASCCVRRCFWVVCSRASVFEEVLNLSERVDASMLAESSSARSISSSFILLSTSVVVSACRFLCNAHLARSCSQLCARLFSCLTSSLSFSMWLLHLYQGLREHHWCLTGVMAMGFLSGGLVCDNL